MKFKNKKTEIDGIVFDSKMESMYYVYLQQKVGEGSITGIDLQPSFVLLPKFTKGKRNIREIIYKADFRVFHADGSIEIIDIKTEATMTPAFRLKWKLFDYFYPDLELKLITKKGSDWVEIDGKKKGKAPAEKGVKRGKRRNVCSPRKRRVKESPLQ